MPPPNLTSFMKMNVTLSPGRLLIFCIVIGFGACKKTDSLITAGAAADTKITQQFFNVSPTEHPLVKRIVAEIQKRNNAYPFVAGFARTNGFAIWDKAILAPKPKTILQRDGDSTLVDTLVYVPLVLANTLQVNGSILAKIKGDSIFLKYVLAQDYKAYPFDGGRTTVTADQFTAFMLLLNREVFGHQTFTITDERLFADPTYPHPDTTTKEVSFDTVQVDNLNIPSVNCMIFQVRICGSNGTGRTSARTITTSPNNCVYYYEEHCYTIYDDSGGWGGGSSGGDSGGSSGGGGIPGGGGGGAPIPHDYPCQTTGTCNPPGGGIGWLPPVSWDDDYNPYLADSVIVDSSISNNYPCVQKIIDSITNYANINAIAQVALKTVFGINKKIKLTIVANASLPYSIDGQTDNGNLNSSEDTYSTTIHLNSWMLNHSTQEYIAATIIHEAVHAYIQYCYHQYTNGHMDSTSFKNMFPLYWPPKSLYQSNNIYFYQMGNSAQHKAMAASMINLMKHPLISLYPNTSINASTRDSVYEAITWGGFGETPSFAVRPDTLYIRAMNSMAKDTSIHSPFTLIGFPGTYYIDSHNLNLNKGCQ